MLSCSYGVDSGRPSRAFYNCRICPPRPIIISNRTYGIPRTKQQILQGHGIVLVPTSLVSGIVRTQQPSIRYLGNKCSEQSLDACMVEALTLGFSLI